MFSQPDVDVDLKDSGMRSLIHFTFRSGRLKDIYMEYIILFNIHVVVE